MRVLIVEDSHLVAERLQDLLRELPVPLTPVGLAHDAEEGCRAVQTLQPSVVILDLGLPRGSGFDVLEASRGVERPPRVIVLTNYATEEYRQRCLAAGADAFLDKSLEFERVRDILEGWLLEQQPA